MYRIDSANKAASLQVPAPAGGGGYFQDTGNPGTVVSADWCNMIQEEIANVVTGAGLVLSKTTFNQLKLAIDAMISGAAPPAATTPYAVAGGTANALTAALPTSPGAYTGGVWCLIKASYANTGAATLNLNGLGAKTIQAAGAALASGMIVAGEIYLFVYDGTEFQLLNPTVAAAASAAPAGALALWLDGAAPSGWALMQGQAISRSANPTLFGLYGTKYGAGDGSTTFNLPNPQGQFTRIFDASGLVDPGRTIGDKQTDAVQSHNHANGVSQAGATGAGGSQLFGDTSNGLAGASSQTVHTDNNSVTRQGYTSTGTEAAGTGTGVPAGTFATETRGKNMSFNLIVKLG